MKIRPLGVELFRMAWVTDRHCEGSGRFLQFCESTQKFQLDRLSLYFRQHNIFFFQIHEIINLVSLLHFLFSIFVIFFFGRGFSTYYRWIFSRFDTKGPGLFPVGYTVHCAQWHLSLPASVSQKSAVPPVRPGHIGVILWNQNRWFRQTALTIPHDHPL